MPPVITKQAPRKHIVDHRELIVIDCEATGSPEIRYSWLKNGRELDVDSDPRIAWLSAPNSGTITIELDADNPDTTYEGMYQCRAANHRGTAVTNEIEVIIATSPLFAFTEDKEITVPRISIDAENNLIFANVEEADAGQYSCRVEYSKLGTIRIANTLTLIVETAPPRAPSLLKRDINVPPVNRGEDLTLRCIAEGLGDAELPSKRNGTRGRTGPPRLQHQIRHLPAATLAEYACHESALSATSGRAAGEERAPEIFGNEAKPRKKISSRLRVAPPPRCNPKLQHPVLLSVSKSSFDRPFSSCPMDTRPTPEVRWKRTSGGNLPADRAKVMGTTLIIKEVVEGDAGSYECTASNYMGKDTKEVMVTVNAAPYWRTEPGGQMLAPGDDATILCEAAGTPTPEVSWKRNGEPLRAKHGLVRDHHFEEKLQDQPNRRVSGTTLFLSDLVKDDSGVYQCIARNNLGTRITNAYINVVEMRPRMLTPANKKYAYVQDQDAQLDCLSFGSPKPTTSWEQRRAACLDMPPVRLGIEPGSPGSQSDDLLLRHPTPQVYKGQLLVGDRYQVLSNGTLVITPVSTEDDGQYKCISTNKYGEEALQAELSVKRKTSIATPPLALEVKAGNEAQFVCMVNHDPDLDLNIIWLKNGIPLRSGSRMNMAVLGTLVIKDTISSDSALYTCLASTPLDETSAQAALSVIDVPEPPLNLQLSNHTEMSVTLSWDMGNDENNSPIEGYTIQYAENRLMPGEWQEMKVIDGRDTLTADLDLHPWIIYQFRVTARNKVGESKPSYATEEYETFASAPNAVPGGIKGEGTKPTNMVISWEPLPGLQQNGPGLRYEVRYRQKPQNRKRRPWTVETVNDPNGKEFIVEDTPTHTAYEITVQAKNDCGDGPLSDVVVGYSGEDFPSAAVEVGDVQPRSVRLDWDPIDEEFFNGDLKGYKVRYWSDDDPDNVMEKTFEGDEPTALVDGLTPYKNYNFELVKTDESVRQEVEEVCGKQQSLLSTVKQRKLIWFGHVCRHNTLAKTILQGTVAGGRKRGRPRKTWLDNIKKWTGLSTAQQIREAEDRTGWTWITAGCSPGAPSALWATVWDSKTLNVQWEPPLQPNGVITGYLLTYRTLPEPGTLEGRLGPRMEIHVDDPTTTAAELSDLEEQTWYRIELQAKTSIGLGDMKELETYTSDPAPPLIPEVVEVLDTGEDFINVSWVPAKVGPRPTQFYVEYRERGTSSGPMWFQTDRVEPDPYSETLQKTIDGLQPGTWYQLRVVASNNFGRALPASRRRQRRENHWNAPRTSAYVFPALECPSAESSRFPVLIGSIPELKPQLRKSSAEKVSALDFQHEEERVSVVPTGLDIVVHPGKHGAEWADATPTLTR
ncbi:ATP-dependent DNA helicase chl1 [Branchiostoma belcheri]|nr:ATP-dependent DNA helicase chl1 [Branchiostoma belcheri]